MSTIIHKEEFGDSVHCHVVLLEHWNTERYFGLSVYLWEGDMEGTQNCGNLFENRHLLTLKRWYVNTTCVTGKQDRG